jgi:hypothetical protein
MGSPLFMFCSDGVLLTGNTIIRKLTQLVCWYRGLSGTAVVMEACYH